MVQFTPNRPVVTREPKVLVDGLKPGEYRFQLVVTDDDGNESKPDEIIVTVSDSTRRLDIQ